METFKLKASADNLELAVALFEPQDAPKGIVQFVHGMCEHKERYYPLLQWLSDAGYICIIHDNRGHGESVKSPEDLGYMYDGGWKALVGDVKVVGDWARSRFPGLEFTLFGHSMGSMIVRSYARRHDYSLDRLIVCGSPSDNSAKLAGKILAWVMGTVGGWHKRPKLLQKMSLGSYNKPFAKEGYKAAWVCSDKQTLEDYHNDPLCQFRFTTNGFYSLFGLMCDCYNAYGWRKDRLDMPIHFISGAEDPCRVSDFDFRKAADMLTTMGYTKVDCKLYTGMRHEILNEGDRMKVWNDVLSFLETR